jgi:hypothetical protein
MGSVTIHSTSPDGKQAHFAVADFWDLTEKHHNLEFWWSDFEGKWGYDKDVVGHRVFSVNSDVKMEACLGSDMVDIQFRGKRSDE